MKYLVTLDIIANTDLEEFQFSSKTLVLKYAVKIMSRIFSDVIATDEVNPEHIDINENDSSECELNETETTQFNMKTALDNVINASLRTRVIEKPTGVNLKSMIQNESKMYDKTGTMPSNLKKLSDALMTIPPTSIERERAFSTSSNFCTKKRSS